MTKTAKVLEVCISDRTGVPKAPVAEGRLLENYGLEGDAHAGTSRQVSLLCEESVRKMHEQGIEAGPGDFAENLLISGLKPEDFVVGLRLRVQTDGEDALLQVTQIGKECHAACVIRKRTGDCVMPREGIFARVLKGGPVRAGSILEVTGAD
jgi:MOSC domain-containing protein YiiM